jgi:hypothetical protein
LQNISQEELSTAAIELLENDIRKGTKRVYASCQKRWILYCLTWQLNPDSPNMVSIVNFLTELKTKHGLTFNSINTYRAAIFHKLASLKAFSPQEYVQLNKLMKALRNQSPPKARYSSIWDISITLKHITSLGDNSTLLLPILSQKLVFLLAAIGISRISELANLACTPLQKLENAWILGLLEWKKNTNILSGNRPTITVPYFPTDHSLCPVLCLQRYLELTKAWRKDTSQRLFLSWIPPHQPVSKDSLGRWLRTMLAASGIDTNVFKAHSIRAASVSKAFANNISIEQIMKTADWSSNSTFVKFYKKAVNIDYGQAVLALK